MKTIFTSLVLVSIFASITLSAKILDQREINSLEGQLQTKLEEMGIQVRSLYLDEECDDWINVFECTAQYNDGSVDFSVTDDRKLNAKESDLRIDQIVDFGND